MTHNKPVIVITMGDPAGVGPEIAVKTVIKPEITEQCHPVIIGSPAILQKEMHKYVPEARAVIVKEIKACDFRPGNINIYDIALPGTEDIRYGNIQHLAGKAAFLSVRKAIDLALRGDADATVTGPIHKKSINEAGYHFAGHTEIYAHYTGTKDYAMLLVSSTLKVIHVTTHVPLREACDLVTKDLVLRKIRLMHEGLQSLGISAPRIGVAGLNPHAGDEGLFGDEDNHQIRPAVETARAQGIDAEGPVPADTLFPKALSGNYDGCVAMYHDQGHIPFKLIGFTWDKKKGKMETVSGVNITLGLPIIRTSVDHGTAFDIAGKGIASTTALEDAIKYAILLVRNKTRT